MVLAVAYVNGFTDAPNSVASCVATKTLTLKKALRIAAISDFAGSITVGIINGRVTERILELSSNGNNGDLYVVSLFSAMLSVVIWAVVASYYGIPTSESHSMLAGIFGASVAVNQGFENINTYKWISTLSGMILSLIFGFISSLLFSELFDRLLKNKNVIIFDRIRVVLCIISSFLHGAQDSQKFAGIILSVIADSFTQNKYSEITTTFVCAIMISIGIVTGGEKIIYEVGSTLVNLNKLRGLSADLSGLVCLGVSTFSGIPVSTTHIKTSSIIGAGFVNGINYNSVIKLILAWIITFPICMVLSYILTLFIIK